MRLSTVLCLAASVSVVAVVPMPVSDAAGQAEDAAALEKQVLDLRSKDLHGAALAAVRKYIEAHPSEAQAASVKRLLADTEERAQEADRLFQKKMGEAKQQLAEVMYDQAIVTAASALGFYPERAGLVRELQERARRLQTGQNIVRVPAGTYRLGSDRPEDDNPKHEVKLKAFSIDKYPVTNEDYLAFVTATGHAAPKHWRDFKPLKGKEHHPVVFVNWNDASAYAQWAGKRLPTAEEWECAASGPDGHEFPWGDTVKDDAPPCNSLEYWQVNKAQVPGTVAVDFFEKQRNAGGVSASMGGNVWEWTSTAAPGKIAGKPSEFRILRGGSFMSNLRAARCADNYAENPRWGHPDVGFRCAKDAE